MLVLFVDTQHAVPVKRCMCMGAAGHESDRMKKHSSCSPDRHACSLQQGLWHLVPLSVPQRCMLARHGPRMIHNSQYREAQCILLMYNGARSLAAVSPSIVLSLSTKMLQCLNNSNKDMLIINNMHSLSGIEGPEMIETECPCIPCREPDTHQACTALAQLLAEGQ